MTSRLISLFLALLSAAPPLLAQGGPVPFRKLRLNPQFYSEGINVGDFDKDKVPDIAAGPYWYPGPDFARKIAFRAPRSAPFDTAGDSDCYSLFPYDFNGDGWTDLLSTRQAGGAEAVWYENNRGADGYWKEHAAYSPAENEAAAFLDIEGTGKPGLITNSRGYGGWAAPSPSDPAAAWAFRRVTGREDWGAFTHGIGAGDVNGDGRTDLIMRTGWWERPADPAETAWVAHRFPFWGQAAALENPGGAQMYAYDVDGDGDNDIVTTLQAHGYGLAWFENKGKGLAFDPHPLLGLPSEKEKYGAAFSQLHALALADLDGDGLQDLVTGKRKGAHGNGLADIDSPAVLYWFRLTRPAGQTPRFTPYLIDSEAGIGTQITLADVNGDGKIDILTARRRGAFVFFNEGAGTGIKAGKAREPEAGGGGSASGSPRESRAPRRLFPLGNDSRDALGRAPGDRASPPPAGNPPGPEARPDPAR